MTPTERKVYRERVLAWCHAAGVATTGKALAAALAGERDLPTLYRLNMADGVKAHTLPDGRTLPGGVKDGDLLFGGTVEGTPLRDPETGHYWISVRAKTDRADGEYAAATTTTLTDHELAPGEPVVVTKPRRRLSPWLQAAHDEYLLARAAWEDKRDAECIGYATEQATFVVENPYPRFSDYVREHAARRRADAGEDPTRYQDTDAA